MSRLATTKHEHIAIAYYGKLHKIVDYNESAQEEGTRYACPSAQEGEDQESLSGDETIGRRLPDRADARQ